jgi:hypothetical protein
MRQIHKLICLVFVLALVVSPVSATKYTVDLDIFQKFEFNVGPEEYEIKLFTVTGTVAASFTINKASDPNTAIVVNILKGESKELDLDSDNIKETQLMLNSVGAGEAAIELTVEEVAQPPTTAATTDTEEQNDTEETKQDVVDNQEQTTEPVCGNGLLETGETSETCCADAGCPSGQQCVANQCTQVRDETATIHMDSEDTPSNNTLWIAAFFVALALIFVLAYAVQTRKKQDKIVDIHKRKIKDFVKKHKQKKPLHLKKTLLEEGHPKKAVEKALKEEGLETPKLKISNIKSKKKKQLEFYIRQRLSYGTSPDDIIDTLVNVGWDKDVIRNLIRDLKKEE